LFERACFSDLKGFHLSPQQNMSFQPKILLLDDEQDLLDMYKDVLSQLPNQPEIHLADSGARAIALLESEPFDLLISDLKMPKMDGLQVLSVVRRRFPDLRVVVMTSIIDEQYRSRAYAMGVDLFWVKPSNAEEIRMFQDCIASLIGREHATGGFRGIQSKSLVDIIQLECLSHSSSVLKIIQGSREGKVWVRDGEIIDAQTGDFTGQAAFKEIFSWKTGAFEILPPEPERTRTIFESSQGLLLDSVQAMDEALHSALTPSAGHETSTFTNRLAKLARSPGVEFLVEISGQNHCECWGVRSAEQLANWTRETWATLRELGEKLQFGEFQQVQGLGWQGHVAITSAPDKALCIGLKRALPPSEVQTTIKTIKDKWAS
jgi:CheY-like chemotaxis protein